MESLLEIVTQPKTWSDLNGEAKIKIIRALDAQAYDRTELIKLTASLLMEITDGASDHTYFIYGVGVDNLEWNGDELITNLDTEEWQWIDDLKSAKKYTKEQWELFFHAMDGLVAGHICAMIVQGNDSATELLTKLITDYYSKEYGSLRPIVFSRRAAKRIGLTLESLIPAQ